MRLGGRGRARAGKGGRSEGQQPEPPDLNRPRPSSSAHLLETRLHLYHEPVVLELDTLFVIAAVARLQLQVLALEKHLRGGGKRGGGVAGRRVARVVRLGSRQQLQPLGPDHPADQTVGADRVVAAVTVQPEVRGARSEEHTSELQSRRELVCRLLLE